MKGIDLKGTKKSKYEHLAKLLGNQLHLNIRKNVSLVYDFQICFFLLSMVCLRRKKHFSQ